jgi:hypothetical protein
MTTEQALSLILQFMLSGQSINADAIVQKLAKDDPVLLCKLLKLHEPSMTYAKMFDAMRDSNKIEAIKQLRTVAGIGLKEAKDVVEVLRREDYAVSEHLMSLTAQHTLSMVRKDLGRDYW